MCNIPSSTYENVVSISSSTPSLWSHCGRCIEVQNDNAEETVIAHVVDSCLSCGPEKIMLGSKAFSKLDELAKGNFYRSWSYVACPEVTKKLSFSWASGSDQYCTNFRIHGFSGGIKSLEYKPRGQTEFKPSKLYGDHTYTIYGQSPFEIRITDFSDETMIATDVIPDQDKKTEHDIEY